MTIVRLFELSSGAVAHSLSGRAFLIIRAPVVTILMSEKIPSVLPAGLNMARTRTQKWLIGCLSAVGVLVLLSGLALGGFLMFMKKLRTVPPESTQIVLYNESNEPLRIDRIDYGAERIVIDADPVLSVREPGKYTAFGASLWGPQPQMSRTLSVYYTGLSSGEQWHVHGNTQRLPNRPCKFVAFLRKGGGEVSACRDNDMQDFEDD